MSEPKTASLGEKLLSVGPPQELVWNRYRERMECAMAELEQRIRRVRKLRLVALSCYVLYVLVGGLCFLLFGGAGDLLQLAVLAVWAVVVIVVGTSIIAVFHTERSQLEVRRDIKELALTVLELKEGLSSRAG
jgi:hypothetical protein